MGIDSGHEYRGAFAGARMTEPRKAVVSAASRMTGAFTVDELFAEVRRADSAVGLATVYRTVAALSESGWLEKVGDRGDSALFARCAETDHHHHIVCEECGTTASASCDLESRLAEVASSQGFTLTRHEVVAYGLCSECSRRTAG